MVAPLTLVRVCDVETTGLDDPAEICELGWTDLRLFPTGWEIESGPYSLLVNPGMPISFPAMAVHHITPADVADGENPDVARQIAVNGADMLCSHNWAFDSRFIRSTLPAICTFKCARTAWPDVQSHGNGSIRYERGLCLGDPRTEPSHRAGPDTWVTAHILLDLLKVLSVEEMVKISRNPVLLTKMTMGEHYGKPFADVPGGFLDWAIRKFADDPSKEDLVFTARHELQKRAADQPKQPEFVDPDAWRKEMGRF